MVRFLLTALLTLPLCLQAQTGSITRSDSLDILHTRIELDLRTFSTSEISAKAVIRFVPKVPGIAVLPLDLLQLHADSVEMNGDPLAYTHVGEDLRIQLGAIYGPDDTLDVSINYSGDPVVDASGWGGFYTLSSYQYDLGVAFDAIPHSFGRSWFPCFDNFVERCSFDFIVTTAGDRTVFANGHLLDEVDLGAGERRTHWRINEPIPSYLASVASTNYVAARDTFPSITGNQVPVTLVARPQDTTEMKASFIHLRNSFDTFERWFGPYRWDRVGYCLTSQGAMEHPTNICYPDAIADGTLTYESTMAHELAHHWFGDLITCRRAEEMYINEGFAEYLSYLFLEDLYGRAEYNTIFRRVHHDMLVKAHLLDQGWHALSEVPQAYTYGEHSYRKGADVIHGLRGHLGDSLFSEGFKRILTNNAFTDMSTEELRDSLNMATGVDLTDFFADRIQQPGWAAFEVDSIMAVPDGAAWNTTLYIEQKLRHADHPYNNVAAHLTFEAMDGTRWTTPGTVVLGGLQSQVSISTPFAPVFAFVDADGLLSLGTSFQSDTLVNPATTSLPLADVSLIVNAMPAPSPIRVEEFWTAADDRTAEPFAFLVSPDRWWRITGQLAANADVDLRITIDGRPTSTSNTDPGLVTDAEGVPFIEDSLVILYRPNAHFPWTVHPTTSINFLGADHTNGNARITAEQMQLGDYCVAWRKSAVGLNEPSAILTGWRVYPNPASEHVIIEAPRAAKHADAILRIHDMQGRLLMERPITATRTQVPLNSLSSEQLVIVSAQLGNGRVIPIGTVLVKP